MKKFLCLVLAALCTCLSLAGCSEAKPSADTATTTQSTARLKVEDCYEFIENADGTYTYVVTERSGITLHADYNRIRPVSFAVANEDVLIVHGQEGVGVGANWAIFCDIENRRVSDCFAGYLGAADGRVAFLDQRTDAYHVFVCDPYAPAVYTSVTTLEGLVMGTDVIEDYAMGEGGVLSVTYTTAEGSKTVEIDLLADQSE